MKESRSIKRVFFNVLQTDKFISNDNRVRSAREKPRRRSSYPQRRCHDSRVNRTVPLCLDSAPLVMHQLSFFSVRRCRNASSKAMQYKARDLAVPAAAKQNSWRYTTWLNKLNIFHFVIYIWKLLNLLESYLKS